MEKSKEKVVAQNINFGTPYNCKIQQFGHGQIFIFMELSDLPQVMHVAMKFIYCSFLLQKHYILA